MFDGLCVRVELEHIDKVWGELHNVGFAVGEPLTGVFYAVSFSEL